MQRWGNSLAIRIPKSFAAETSLEPGSEVELGLEDGRLVITPVGDAGYSLDELLSKVTAANLHGEVETGPAVGTEIW